jgi:purine-binding chemotaxis protein CheW
MNDVAQARPIQARPPEAAGGTFFDAAAAGKADTAEENARQFITFTLGDQEYGVDIMLVREIKGWTETTALPQAPCYVRGVINLRGIIVPILDLRARFDMGVTEPGPMHVVIIVTIGSRTTGLLVDSVSDIIAVERNQIRAVPEVGLPAENAFLEGLVALNDRMVTLVSLDFLLRAANPHAELHYAA